jgi:peptidyl-prolyl cis-trans isomerase SurA
MVLRFLLLLVFLSVVPFSAQAEIIERIVAIVNGEVITKTDVQSFSKKLKEKNLVDELLVSDVDELLKDRKKMIAHMIDEKIIDSAVKDQQLDVTIERVEQEIRKIARKNRISRAQLKARLKMEGVSFSEYQDFLKKRLERQTLIERAVTSKIKISDEDISSYYMSQYKTSGTEVFEYTLSHILFLKAKGKEDAMTRANLVLKKIKGGQSFDKLASQYSEDPNFSAGGRLGTFKSGEFLKELEGAAKNLEVNGISNIVETKIGFHILRLHKKRLVTDPMLESKKAEIKGILYQKSFQKQFAFWLEQKRQEAFIKIN